MGFSGCPCYWPLGRTNWAPILGRWQGPRRFNELTFFLGLVSGPACLFFKPYHQQCTQNFLNLEPIYNRTPLGPFTAMNQFFGSIHQQITMIPKHTTKPEDISPEIKTKSQHSPGLPENSFENPIRTVRK